MGVALVHEKAFRDHGSGFVVMLGVIILPYLILCWHIITGGWAHRFQANLTYFLGPTLVGPTATRASEASATFGFDSVKQFHMNKLIFLIENNYHDISCDGVMTDLT